MKKTSTRPETPETKEALGKRVLDAENRIRQVLESTNTRLDVKVILREGSITPVVTVISK